MGRKASFDRLALGQLLAAQHGLVTRQQVIGSCGMNEATLRYRLRADGPWKTVLPGVYLSVTAELTCAQREMAAQLYAGPLGVITGVAAMAGHGMAVEQYTTVDVLIPARNHRHSESFAHVMRTTRMPATVYLAGPIRYAPAARAVADAARQLRDISAVRSLVANAVQWRKVSVSALADELRNGPIPGAALLRKALAEVADGVRSTAEADLRALVKKASLPGPLYNPKLFLGEDFVAMPDAWWAESGVAVEVDSRQWHLSPASWERTMARHSRMSALGIIVLHYPPARLRSEPKTIAAQISSALAAGRGRKLPRFRVVPAAGRDALRHGNGPAR